MHDLKTSRVVCFAANGSSQGRRQGHRGGNSYAIRQMALQMLRVSHELPSFAFASALGKEEDICCLGRTMRRRRIQSRCFSIESRAYQASKFSSFGAGNCHCTASDSTLPRSHEFDTYLTSEESKRSCSKKRLNRQHRNVEELRKLSPFNFEISRSSRRWDRRSTNEIIYLNKLHRWRVQPLEIYYSRNFVGLVSA